MSIQKAIQARRFLELTDELRALQQAEKFAELLALARKSAADPAYASPAAQGRLQYYEAIALDVMGQGGEAFSMLLQLVEAFPGAPDMEHSLRVVCNGLERKAEQLVNADPLSAELSSILGALEQVRLPPYWLVFSVAMQEAGRGEKDQAWARIQALLALSPNDAEYLGCAISIAKACQRPAHRSALLNHIAKLWAERPSRLELASLLEREGFTPATPQAS
jgi:hypothetical protein